MKFKIIIILLLYIASSCDNILKEDPKDFLSADQYFNTESEAEAALYGVYDYLNDIDIAENRSILWGSQGTDVGNGRLWEIRNGELDNFTPDISTWRNLYRAIAAANMVIYRLESSEEFSDQYKNQILGEASFLRAFFYSRLNLYWGNVPIWLDELDFDQVEKLPNSTADEVNDQIISDLEFAVANLSTEAKEQGRISQWIAKGFLARIYLFDKQYAKAKALAKDVIENSGYALLNNYADVFDWNNKFNSELIHVVPKLAEVKNSTIHSLSSPRPPDDGPAIKKILSANNQLKIIRPDGVLTTDVGSRNPGSMFQGWGSHLALEEYYNSFEPGDTRKDLIWHEVKFTDGTTYKLTGGGAAGADLKGHAGYYWLKWIAWDEAPNRGGRDTHLQRLAELYLIWAEAENEINGPTPEALEAINTIRRRAFGDSEHDLSGLTKEELREAIINENKWELGGEGLRKWYLWHWGFETYLKAVESVSESLPLLKQNLKPYHQYWRIPDSELAKNPNLVQNPGY